MWCCTIVFFDYIYLSLQWPVEVLQPKRQTADNIHFYSSDFKVLARKWTEKEFIPTAILTLWYVLPSPGSLWLTDVYWCVAGITEAWLEVTLLLSMLYVQQNAEASNFLSFFLAEVIGLPCWILWGGGRWCHILDRYHHLTNNSSSSIYSYIHYLIK